MYNSPRAFSIVTSQPGKLLKLDRSVFSQILKTAACRKWSMIKSAVDKIEILKAIQPQLRYVTAYLETSLLVFLRRRGIVRTVMSLSRASKHKNYTSFWRALWNQKNTRTMGQKLPLATRKAIILES